MCAPALYVTLNLVTAEHHKQLRHTIKVLLHAHANIIRHAQQQIKCPNVSLIGKNCNDLQKTIYKSNCHHSCINKVIMLGLFQNKNDCFFAHSSLNQICQFHISFKESNHKYHKYCGKAKILTCLIVCVCVSWGGGSVQVCLCVFQARVQRVPGLIALSESSRCKLSFKYFQPSLISLQAEGFSKHVYQVFLLTT